MRATRNINPKTPVGAPGDQAPGLPRRHSASVGTNSRMHVEMALVEAQIAWISSGGQGVHREVESEGLAEKYRAVVEGATPQTNWSAKGGARSSRQYDGEGVPVHPPHQGVCRRHGTEDQCVTPGGLIGFAGGTAISDRISVAKSEAMLDESSDGRIVPQVQRKLCDQAIGSRVGWGSRSAKTVGERRKREEKGGRGWIVP